MVTFAGIKFIEDPTAVAPFLESNIESERKTQRAYVMSNGTIRIVEMRWGIDTEWREVFHPNRSAPEPDVKGSAP